MPFQVFKKVQAGPLSAIMTLVGSDPLLREKLRQSLVERALGQALKDMNFAKFSGGDDDMSRLVDACRDYPCFAEKRVVVLTEPEKIKKKESQNLLPYLKDPQDSTLLLLDSQKLDGRLDWVKALKKSGAFIQIPDIAVGDAVAWTRKCFAREKQEFEAGIPEEMVGRLGLSLGILQNSVTQLSLFVGGDRPVSRQDLVELLVEISEENVFEVIDSIFSGNLKKLQYTLGRLLEAGEPPLKILSLLFRHLSILLAMGSGSGGAGRDLFPMPPWARRQYESQAGRYARQLNYSMLKPLTEADIQLKGSPLPKALILQNCVEKIVGLLA